MSVNTYNDRNIIGEKLNIGDNKASTDETNQPQGSSNGMGAIPGPRISRKDSKARKGSVFETPIDLDYVLKNELGQFGRYQIYALLLVTVPTMMSALSTEYIFSSAAIPHRCLIHECGETSATAVYDNPGVAAAFPEDVSCERYVPLGNGTPNACPAALFDQGNTIDCEGFVYARTNSIVYDFDLGCQEWLRVLPGTLSSVGTLLALPITGYVSDRFGRRVAFLINLFNVVVLGIIIAFSVNYPMYAVMELLQTTFGSGAFSASYIILTEMVGPKYRVLTSATCTSMFSLGQVVVACVAWLVQPWRQMVLAVHVPCFLVLAYCWLLGESVRWLLSQERYVEARAVLEKVAKINKKKISDKSMQALLNTPKAPVKSGGSGLISSIIRSPILLRRVCTTPIWWITSTIVYYGLSINSTNLLSTNMYLNYILTCAIEIPGFYTAVLLNDRIGRKATLSVGYFLSAVCNIVFSFIPNNLQALNFCIFLLGKFCISTVATTLYLYTAELYPTQFRHTLLAFSSMIGRIGSIIAPLTPVLTIYWSGIPTMMFGTMGLISGVLVLTQPETLGTRMPDTLAEAEALGRPESKVKQDS